MRSVIEHGRAAFWAAFLLVLLTGLTGCKTPADIPAPASAEERVVRESIRAQKIADAAELTSMDLLERRVIKSSQAQDVAKAAQSVRGAAQATRMALAQEWRADSALPILRAADASLTILIGFLDANGKEVPK